MDPLSVGASVIAVVGATGKLVKGIHRLKAMQDAPRELDDLLTEVSQFKLVIQAFQGVNANIESELGILLKTAQGLVTEFESLIEYKLTEPGTSNKVDRWQWIRSSKDVERLRVKLRDVTASLVALVGVNTSMIVDQVSQTTKEMLCEHRQHSSQILSSVTHMVQLIEESPSTRAALNVSLGNFRQLTLEPASQINDTGALIPRSRLLQPDGTASTSVVRISKIQKATICTSYCACKCHRFRHIRPPRILSNIFGYGYVEAAGSFFWKTQCDTLLCKAHVAPRHVSVQYRLPQWLASRMIVMWFTSCPPCSPELLLRVPRVVDRRNAAFEEIWLDSDLESWKVAIMKGDCTPYDVNDRGESLLTLLFSFCRWDHLSHLSNYREYWKPSSVTPEDGRTIWENLITLTNPYRSTSGTRPPRDNVLRFTSRLIDFDDYSEGQKFTRIHQIVCGLSNVPLDAELQVSTDIDTLDGEGRTALWYAVAHRRHDYICKLLEAGANPNIGHPPSLVAAKDHSDYAIIKALLDYGASFGSFDRISILAWWAGIYGSDALAVDELLVNHGLDPNQRGGGGQTILMCLIDRHSDIYPRRLKQLIELGSDIEITDERGWTAIMYAVCNSSPSAFGVFARAGARVDLKSAKGSTILHLAVGNEYSTRARDVPGLCESFRDADLTKLDLDAKDEDGRRAFDLLRIRNGPNWEDYCAHIGRFRYRPLNEEEFEAELEAISALEQLLHHVQQVQGVPEADRYPPLGEYCSRVIEEEPVPGAWPVY